MAEVKVSFVCTQRGRHPARLLLPAWVAADGTVEFAQAPEDQSLKARDGRGRPRYSYISVKADADAEPYGAVRLICPSCPLHVEWRQDRAEAVTLECAARSVTEFDVSRMS